MTLKEAKKILKKEGFYVEKATRPCAISELFIEYEDPTICEAMQVVSSAGYFVCMEMSCFAERKARLKKELEEHGNAPMPGPGEKQSKEKKGIIYPSTSPKADFYYKHVLNEGNPALREASSQFNDALLDEQAKKIKHLTKKIARLNKIIHKKNLKIEEFRKESSRHLRGKVKMFGETVNLSQELCDKNEDIRLSKIREKNLTDVCQKYVKENEKLKKKLADKIVDKIDAQALKSAESALAYKEKVIAEKDEVIADLGNELAATKKELKENINRVKAVRNASKGYCDYGLAAEKMIQEMAKAIVGEKPICSEDFEQYRLWANGSRFNPQLPGLSEEEEKKLSSDRNTHPTEDNPEEIEIEKAVKLVRKAMKEGHRVTIDYKD